MLTVENQLEALYKFVGPGVISGWTIEKLSDLRSDQLSLINDYVIDPYSHSGQIIIRKIRFICTRNGRVWRCWICRTLDFRTFSDSASEDLPRNENSTNSLS